MTNKNPYEIRLDILKMAQEMLDKDFTAKQATYITKLNLGMNDPGGTRAPKSLDSIDVINMANSLYAFVATDSRSVANITNDVNNSKVTLAAGIAPNAKSTSSTAKK